MVAEAALDVEPKARIFISYSRKDMAFADRLEAALKARGFEPLIDRTEIYAFEDWWKRIEALIGKADTVVFVLSPDAVASEIALKEITHAASLNKRFAPIVCRRVEDRAIPQALQRLNFIFFDDPARFEESADQLAEALQTDIGWVRQHTEFGELTRRWSKADRPGGLLLRSPVLEEAERWIASRPRGAPEPTEETQAFITDSRRGTTRRRNVLTGSLAAGLVVAFALAGLAYWQRGIAAEQRDVAEKRRIVTLAELATSERVRGNWDTALRLVVHAARLLLALDQEGGVEISVPHSALAAAVSQSSWLLMLRPGGNAGFGPNRAHKVTTWDGAITKKISFLPGHDNEVTSAAFSPDGKRIITAAGWTAQIWDVATGTEIAIRGQESAVTFAALDPDGTRIIAACEDNAVRIFDLATGNEIAVLGHKDDVRSAAFSPDGERIITVSGNAVHVWDAMSAKEVAVLGGHDRPVFSAAFSSDGKRIVTASGYAGSDYGTARIWDATSAKEVAVLRGHKGSVFSAAFSSDGERIVTASDDGTARIWDVVTAKEVAVLRGHEDDDVRYAAFSPDGTRVVTGSDDRTARIWNAATAEEIAVLRGHEAAVTFAAFSPDGTRIVTTAGDGARIWSAAPEKPIIVLRGHKGRVRSAAFSADGTRIVTGSDDRTARVWDAASA
jgi:WD40 repeat protein